MADRGAAKWRFGGRRELLLAKAGYQRRVGDAEGMRKTLQRVAAVNPDDPAQR